MRISRIASQIGESATLRLNATAAALRARGEQVIHLGGGEPKGKAPVGAISAAEELLRTGEVRYTPAAGVPALREAVVDYTQAYYQHGIKPGNVLISAGAKQSIMVALQVALDPGDEVIYPVPYWVSYPDMARLCGATGVGVKPADGSFHPTLEDIERAVSERTRAVIINSPNNPSGVVYSAEFVEQIVRFCEERDLYLIMDDIYQRLVFGGKKAVSCFDFARVQGDESKLIAVNGVSKQYAMTGFRVGWAVGAEPLIKVMARIQGHQTSGASQLSQEAALGALRGDQSSVDELRETLAHNRDVLLECLQSVERARVTSPDGTFYCLVDFRAYDEDSNRLAQFLLEKALVVTIPGDAFGLEGFLRISFCGAEQDIREGVGRIAGALRDYPGRGV